MLECGLCDKPFPVIADLLEHQRKVHHAIPNENKKRKDKFTYDAFDTEDKENIAPNFKCGICSRSFPYRSKLIRHIDESHSSKGSKGDERRKSINQSKNLKKHIKVISKWSESNDDIDSTSKSTSDLGSKDSFDPDLNTDPDANRYYFSPLGEFCKTFEHLINQVKKTQHMEKFALNSVPETPTWWSGSKKKSAPTREIVSVSKSPDVKAQKSKTIETFVKIIDNYDYFSRSGFKKIQPTKEVVNTPKSPDLDQQKTETIDTGVKVIDNTEYFNRLDTKRCLFKCKVCLSKNIFKSFISSKDQLDHLIEEHSRMTDPENKYLCEFSKCNRTFPTRNHLQMHLRSIHSNVRHTCKCHKAFLTHEELKGHVQSVHHGVRYSCSACHVKFKLRKNFRNITHSDHGNKIARAIVIIPFMQRQFKAHVDMSKEMPILANAKRQYDSRVDPFKSKGSKFIEKQLSAKANLIIANSKMSEFEKRKVPLSMKTKSSGFLEKQLSAKANLIIANSKMVKRQVPIPMKAKVNTIRKVTLEKSKTTEMETPKFASYPEKTLNLGQVQHMNSSMDLGLDNLVFQLYDSEQQVMDTSLSIQGTQLNINNQWQNVSNGLETENRTLNFSEF